MSRGQHIYGRHPVSEALRGRPRDVQRLFVSEAGPGGRLGDLVQLAQHHGVQVSVVSKHRLRELVGEVPHQGVVAAMTPFAYADLDAVLDDLQGAGTVPLLLALDQVQDPHNLGSLIRSGLALGAHAVLFPKDRAAEVTPTVVKISAGATAHLPIVRITNMRNTLEELKRRELWIYGTVADEGRPLTEVDLVRPCVVVVGSEGQGLRRLVAETCDELVHIPMSGRLGSLNAAVAGAIVVYEAARQRGAAARRK